MRLGLFGGSFDPVHLGHLALARCCQQQAELDEVWFLPTATQPLKRRGPVASDTERIDMLQLAITDEPSWHVSTLEIERGGLSYTVETLRHLRQQMPEAELFFMMGADALHDLPNWREPEAICTLATPLVVARAGEPEPDFDVLHSVCSAERVDEIRKHRVVMQSMAIASSDIRLRLSRGGDVASLLPPQVHQYILEHALYR